MSSQTAPRTDRVRVLIDGAPDVIDVAAYLRVRQNLGRVMDIIPVGDGDDESLIRMVVSEKRREMPGSSHYVIRSLYSDGSWCDRRYNGEGVFLTVTAIHTIADTELMQS